MKKVIYYLVLFFLLTPIATTIQLTENNNINFQENMLTEKSGLSFDTKNSIQLQTQTTVDTYKINSETNEFTTETIKTIENSPVNKLGLNGTMLDSISSQSVTTPAGIDLMTHEQNDFLYGKGSVTNNQYGPNNNTFYSKLRTLEDNRDDTGLIKSFTMNQNAQINLNNGFGYVQNGQLPTMFHHTEINLDREDYVYNEYDNNLWLYFWRINKVRYEIQILDENGQTVDIFDGNKFLINLDKSSILRLFKYLGYSQKNAGESNIPWLSGIESSSNQVDPNSEYNKLLLWAIEKILKSKIPYYEDIKFAITTLWELLPDDPTVEDVTNINIDPKTFILEYDPRRNLNTAPLPYYVNINLLLLADYLANNRLHEIKVKTIAETIQLTHKASNKATGTGSTAWYWVEESNVSFVEPLSIEDSFQYIEPQTSNEIYAIQPQTTDLTYIPDIQIVNINNPNTNSVDAFITKLSDNQYKPLVIMFYNYASNARETRITILPPAAQPILNWFDYNNNQISTSTYLQIDSTTKVMTINESASTILTGVSTYYPLIMQVNTAPSQPQLYSGPTGQNAGIVGKSLSYSFYSTDEDNILYEIDWGDGETTITSSFTSGTTLTESHIWNTFGTFQVSIQAVDIYAASSEPLILSVGIFQFSAPTISGTSSGREDTDYSFTFSGSSPTGTIRFIVDWGDGTSTTSYWVTSSTLLVHQWVNVGTYTITVYAEDRYGHSSDTETYNTNIVSYSIPAPTIAGSSSGNEDSSYAFDFRTTDPNGGTIRYVVNWGDGTTTTSNWLASGTTLTMTHIWYTPNTYTISVSAEDRNGHSSTSTTTSFVVNAYGLPAPSISGATSGNPRTTYSFSFKSTDPNGGRIRYVVNWGDGTTTTSNWVSSGTTVTLGHSWSLSGSKTISAYTQDRYGHSSSSSSHNIYLSSPSPSPPCSGRRCLTMNTENKNNLSFLSTNNIEIKTNIAIIVKEKQFKNISIS